MCSWFFFFGTFLNYCQANIAVWYQLTQRFVLQSLWVDMCVCDFHPSSIWRQLSDQTSYLKLINSPPFHPYKFSKRKKTHNADITVAKSIFYTVYVEMWSMSKSVKLTGVGSFMHLVLWFFFFSWAFIQDSYICAGKAQLEVIVNEVRSPYQHIFLLFAFLSLNRQCM